MKIRPLCYALFYDKKRDRYDKLKGHCQQQIFESASEIKRAIFKISPVLTLRRLMSYIYIYMEHPFLMFLDHTKRRSTVGRTPLGE